MSAGAQSATAAVLLIAVISLLFWLRGWWSHRPVRDRPDIPYKVFTAEFDIVAQARDVPAIVRASGDAGHIPRNTAITDPQERVAAARNAYGAVSLDDRRKLHAVLEAMRQDSSIAVLIDLSGSMRDRIVTLAGQLRILAEEFDSLEIDAAILGFTTSSWKGGRAREAWIAAGKSKRPGRLCPLLHIVFKPFEKPLEEEDWLVLLDPVCLRENVDGEAIEWAADLLREQTGADRRLILVSDGVPMDDSTLAANGSAYLPRHMQKVVAGLTDAGDIQAASIGLDSNYPSVFSRHELIEDMSDFLGAFIRISDNMNHKATAWRDGVSVPDER